MNDYYQVKIIITIKKSEYTNKNSNFGTISFFRYKFAYYRTCTYIDGGYNIH